MRKMKRKIKDSVFSRLFRDPAYRLALYQYLHPEDTEVRMEDCRLISTENILTDGQYNDLGMQVRDLLLILVEAQSIFSPNLPFRMLLYIADAYKRYVAQHHIWFYSATPIQIPKVELYVVYTGTKKNVPDILRLSDLCTGYSCIEVTVKVLRGGDQSIVGQYVAFCQIADQQRAKYGYTHTAILETLRICEEQGILVPFLTERREEVVEVMDFLFSEEELMLLEQQYIEDQFQKRQQESWQEGRQEGQQEGQQKTFLYTLQNLIQATGVSIEQAMATLGVPEPDRPIYRELLSNP